VKEQETREMEERDAAGYARKPSEAGEVEEWESEQVWPDGDDQPHGEGANRVAADGIIVTEEPQSDREFTLEELLAGVAKKNLHREVDLGKPVGKETW
jgi:hypothetical protein